MTESQKLAEQGVCYVWMAPEDKKRARQVKLQECLLGRDKEFNGWALVPKPFSNVSRR